jgi:predicted nucleotidyltransferase
MEKSRNASGGKGRILLAKGSINYGRCTFSGSRHPQAGNLSQFLPMYAKLFEKLLSGGVEFLILGGAAVSLHGFPRMTNDIDILLKNSSENIARFVTAISGWGEGLGADLTQVDFQGPGCVRIEEDFPLDVFTLLDGKPYEQFDAAAVKYVLAQGIEVRCLAIADLIELKKATHREKDELDVAALRRLQVSPESELPPTIVLDVPPS